MYQHNQHKSSVINLQPFVSNQVLWLGANRYLTGVRGEEGKREHRFEVCFGLKYLSSTEDWRWGWWRGCYRSWRTHRASLDCATCLFTSNLLRINPGQWDGQWSAEREEWVGQRTKGCLWLFVNAGSCPHRHEWHLNGGRWFGIWKSSWGWRHGLGPRGDVRL